MTVFEVLTVVLIIALAAATVVAIYLGLLNWIGAVYVVRCAECRHLAFSSANQPRTSCPHCRHPVLTHPIHALRHPAARTDVRVASDRLHY
jgi:DNA-directed RNA polymerase subunit RPC12/RpoP